MDFKRALITGASAGIGEATARSLAAAGLDLVLLARRKEKLEKLREELQSKHKIRVICIQADIRVWSEVKAALESQTNEIEKVDVLINNAGLARGTDKLQTADLEDMNEMVDTNVKGLLALTRYMLPIFLKNNRGHIINMGSVAGRWTYAGGAVYCATKFAVRAISDGLRMDLLGTPIRVTNIEPGMVETEFTEVRLKGKGDAKAVYKGMIPLSAQDIADSITWSLSRPAHVNIQEIVIFPTDQAAVGQVYRR